ncbi:MAG: PEP-CTERM sorting domain-containing protein [Planctomycetota bacterium]
MKTTLLFLAAIASFTFSTNPCQGEVASDIYLSFAGIGDGSASMATSKDFIIGQSGSAYVWVDDSVSLDTGAFLDITSLTASVIGFTGAEVFDADIFFAGTSTVADSRWEVVGPGTVTGDSIDELRAFRVIGGTGILPSQATSVGGAFVDALHDPSSSAFLFARMDFDVIGIGETTFSLTEGSGLIVNGGSLVNPTFGSATVRATAVPEPSTFGLLVAAFGCVSLRLRRLTF